MSLRSGLSLAFAYVLLLAILALGLPLALGVDDRVGTEVRAQARSQADVVAATASDLLTDRAALDRLARTAGGSVRGRVTVVDSRGRVLADSTDVEAVGESYRARPEFRAALTGRAVQDTRDSRTLDQRILATAVPVLRSGRPAGAVRVTQSAEAIDRAERRSLLGLAALAAVVLLIGLGVGALLARAISRPLRRLDATARRIAEGDMDQRAQVEGSREQRSLARAFNTMTDRLAESLDSQRRFVADASHQLRTPLTGLKLRMEEARAETNEPAVRAEIDAGLAEVDRLSAIVEELLLLSSAGERSVSPEWIDLTEAARDARMRWRGLADERGIALDVRAGPSAGGVTCSRAALDGAVDVLIENALRYSTPGTVVEVVAGPDRIEVLDRGPGLEDGEQELVLQRFHRGSAGRRGPTGSGLGLPIAAELAREWGADVILVNRQGGGARAVLSWAGQERR